MEPDQADVVKFFHDLNLSLHIHQGVLDCHRSVSLVPHIVFLLLECRLAVDFDRLPNDSIMILTKFSSVSLRRASFTTPKEPAPSYLIIEY